MNYISKRYLLILILPAFTTKSGNVLPDNWIPAREVSAVPLQTKKHPTNPMITDANKIGASVSFHFELFDEEDNKLLSQDILKQKYLIGTIPYAFIYLPDILNHAKEVIMHYFDQGRNRYTFSQFDLTKVSLIHPFYLTLITEDGRETVVYDTYQPQTSIKRSYYIPLSTEQTYNRLSILISLHPQGEKTYFEQ